MVSTFEILRHRYNAITVSKVKFQLHMASGASKWKLKASTNFNKTWYTNTFGAKDDYHVHWDYPMGMEGLKKENDGNFFMLQPISMKLGTQIP